MGQLRQEMTDENRVYSAVTIKLLFKGKNDQGLGNIFAQQFDAPLPPRPELRANVVHDGNSATVHLARYAPVEGWGINHDRQIRLAPVGFPDQVVKQAVDFWQMAENFGDANDGEILGVYYCVAACGAHAVAADSEKFQ